MKVFALFVLVLTGLVPTHADTIIDNLAGMLTQDSVLPLAPGVALELATNIWDAHESTPYALVEADSLTLSFESVLRAISLEVWPGGPTEITDPINTPYPFIQSQIAIDDRAAVAFYVNGVLWQPGDVINFGDVPVVTPEPATLLLLTVPLLLALMRWAQMSLRKLSRH